MGFIMFDWSRKSMVIYTGIHRQSQYISVLSPFTQVDQTKRLRGNFRTNPNQIFLANRLDLSQSFMAQRASVIIYQI